MMDAGPAARVCRCKLKCYWLDAAVTKTIVVLLNMQKRGSTVIYTEVAHQTLVAGQNVTLVNKKCNIALKTEPMIW